MKELPNRLLIYLVTDSVLHVLLGSLPTCSKISIHTFNFIYLHFHGWRLNNLSDFACPFPHDSWWYSAFLFEVSDCMNRFICMCVHDGERSLFFVWNDQCLSYISCKMTTFNLLCVFVCVFSSYYKPQGWPQGSPEQDLWVWPLLLVSHRCKLPACGGHAVKYFFIPLSLTTPTGLTQM